jgi:hypothetical protein
MIDRHAALQHCLRLYRAYGLLHYHARNSIHLFTHLHQQRRSRQFVRASTGTSDLLQPSRVAGVALAELPLKGDGLGLH